MAEELELKDAVVSLQEATKALNKQKAAHDEFKKTVDAQLDEIKAKGSADALLEEKLTKLNAEMDKHKETLDAFEVSQKRTSKTYVDDNGNAIDLDAKAQDWRDRLARGREEQSEEFKNDDLIAYKTHWLKFARKSKDALSADETKALSVGSDPDGGFFVPPDMTNLISKKVFETSPMRQHASVQVTGRDAVEGFYDDNEVGFGWVGETADRPETDTPKVGKWSIPIHEAYANPKTTQRILDDADFSIEGWLNGKIADRLSRAENGAFCTGDGVEKPRGFLTYDDGTSIREQIEQKGTGVSGGFKATPDGGDTLIEALYALKAQYRNNAKWFMNRATVAAVRKLKDSNGAMLWAPGIAAGQPAMLMGYPQVDFEDMADVAAGSLSIAVGDMASAYLIAERQGIRMLRDPYTSKPYIMFYATQRVGGGLVNGEALKIIKFD